MADALTPKELTEYMAECPYKPGNRLKLHLEEPYAGMTAVATIIKAFEPFTLSCAMVVSVDSDIPELQGEMVLKLFDRRFAIEHRLNQLAPPWEWKTELQFYLDILNGVVPEFIASYDPNKSKAETWNNAQHEAFVSALIKQYHEVEIHAYELMKDLQGKYIPRVFAQVTTRVAEDRLDSIGDYADIEGILMSHIEGFSLENLPVQAPREKWQNIGEEAIQIIHFVMDRGVLNKDVHRRSFLVNPHTFAVYMIDFGDCVFRHAFRTEDSWRKAQAEIDEEGAVGITLQKHTKGGFKWRQSNRFLALEEYRRESFGEVVSDESFMEEDSPPQSP
ncbi:uncharacterized protein N7459_003413 [Penicillium hispanicum]|uniref:uncharacterized protein n=1 Tax=Penicillium hispanicum TaxID=1080232 RepID=UPI0025425A05|nr:uncharacterized protein N7459_003413 [Penicillium hispanicum]KAJ5587648.1 hypothetical protein N7459_003413 [Penicillium hispanicum]